MKSEPRDRRRLAPSSARFTRCSPFGGLQSVIALVPCVLLVGCIGTPDWDSLPKGFQIGVDLGWVYNLERVDAKRVVPVPGTGQVVVTDGSGVELVMIRGRERARGWGLKFEEKVIAGGTTLLGGDLLHVGGDGVVRLIEPASGKVRWETTILRERETDRNDIAMPGNPITICDGKVIVPCGNLRRLSILDAATGAMLGDISSRGDVFSSPIQGVDSFFVLDDSGNIRSYGLANLKEGWRRRFTAGVSQAAYSGGRLFIISGGILHSLIEEDGRIAWSAYCGEASHITFVGDAVVTGGDSTLISFHRSNGTYQGSAFLGAGDVVRGDRRLVGMCARAGMLIAATTAGTVHCFLGLGLDEAWVRDVEEAVVWGPHIDDDLVVLMTDSNKLVALTPRAGPSVVGTTRARRILRTPPAAQLDFGNDGHTLAVGDTAGRVHVWDWRGRKRIHEFPAHDGEIVSMAFAAGGRRIVTLGGDGYIRSWSPPARAEEFESKAASGAGYLHMDVARDGDLLASVSEQGIEILDGVSGTRLKEWSVRSRGIVSASAHPNGGVVVTSDQEGRVVMWDARSGSQIAQTHGDRSVVRLVKCSPAGAYVAGVEDGQAIHLWKASDLQRTTVLEAPSGRITDLVFAANDKVLFFGTEDGMVYRHLIGSAGPPALIVRCASGVDALACTRDGRLLAISGEAYGVLICEVP